MAENQHLVPIVIEKTGRGERSYDIYSRLLRDRMVFIGGALDDDIRDPSMMMPLVYQLASLQVLGQLVAELLALGEPLAA